LLKPDMKCSWLNVLASLLLALELAD
jgi:hypothetical protein